MKKLNNSDFELIHNIIQEIDFNYDSEKQKNTLILSELWENTTGKKISKLTKVFEFSDDNVITVLCADSFTANELYFSKENLLELMKEKAQNLGIKIKDIKFNYKKWKEKNDE